MRDFLLHLRLHYQVFILSGPYLLGGLLAGTASAAGAGASTLAPLRDWPSFLLHFVTVHIFLFGGVTVYNSFWDKDQGPIGGLRRPPPLAPWTLPASWLVQGLGLVLAAFADARFLAAYLISGLLFYLYSSPRHRWKGRPWPSLFAIGVSTGSCSLLMGFFAAGGAGLPPSVLLAALGVALVLLSKYPLSQVYQVEEDARRGDRTFALAFGMRGVRRLYLSCYGAGLALCALGLFRLSPALSAIFVAAGLGMGVLVYSRLRRLSGRSSEYETVMRIKFLASGLFVAFLLLALTRF